MPPPPLRISVISLFTKAITLAAKSLQHPPPSPGNATEMRGDEGGSEGEGAPSTAGLAAASGLADEIKQTLVERFCVRLK